MIDSRDLIATWPTDPADRLRAVLDLHPNRHDDDLLLGAASEGGVHVGLTWGDLRDIAERVSN